MNCASCGRQIEADVDTCPACAAPAEAAGQAPPPGSWAAFDLLRERHEAASAASGTAPGQSAQPSPASAPDQAGALDQAGAAGQTGIMAGFGGALQSTGDALKDRGVALRDRGVELVNASGLVPAITSLPSLAWVTTRPRTARDSLKVHRRNQRVLTICFLVAALAAALGLASAQVMRHIGALRMSPVGGASPRVAHTTPATSATPTPTPTPEAGDDDNRAANLPSSAKVCSTTVGASQATSCGLAKAVQAALPDKPKGTFQLKATSPVSGTNYEFSCTADRMVICSRGTSVRVYVLY